MNSGKLFNFKYLMQNMKKSKGLLMLLTIVVPIITSLMLILYNSNNSKSYYTVIEPGNLYIVNILGMLIIPFILSVALYGYVYNKKSVDFIGSMPINRTAIYVTNFVGGIILITIIQVVTLALTAILSTVLASIYIPVKLMIDVFILMTVSYIFIFAVSSLAMTISGNFLVQIVVTMLILFLIPFILTAPNMNDGSREFNIDFGDRTVQADEVVFSDGYTMPYQLIMTGFDYSSDFYSLHSIIKMILLTIIYLGLGIYLFNKRKMEDVGQSFSNIWEHLIVKALTLTPMVFILIALDFFGEISFFVAIAFMFIYYIVYDFVTRKKVSFKYNVASFILAFLILTGTYKALNYIDRTLLVKNIDADDIAGFGINLGISGSEDIFKNEELDVIVENKALVKEFADSLEDKKSYLYDRYNVQVYDSMEDDNKEEERILMASYKDIKLKLKNGKKILVRCYVDNEFLSNFANLIIEDKNLYEKYNNLLDFNDLQLLFSTRLIGKEITKEFEKVLSDSVTLKSLQFNEVNGKFIKDDDEYPHIDCYQYKNHEMRNYEISKELNDEIFSFLTTVINKNFFEQIKDER